MSQYLRIIGYPHLAILFFNIYNIYRVLAFARGRRVFLYFNVNFTFLVIFALYTGICFYCHLSYTLQTNTTIPDYCPF